MGGIFSAAKYLKSIHTAIGIILMVIMIIYIFSLAFTGPDGTLWGGVVLGSLGIAYTISTLIIYNYERKLAGVNSILGLSGGDFHEDDDSHSGGLFGFNALKKQAQESAARVIDKAKTAARDTAQDMQAEATALAKSVKNEAVLATQNATTQLNASVEDALSSVAASDKAGTMGAFE
jgi:hypothetical protein